MSPASSLFLPICDCHSWDFCFDGKQGWVFEGLCAAELIFWVASRPFRFRVVGGGGVLQFILGGWWGGPSIHLVGGLGLGLGGHPHWWRSCDWIAQQLPQCRDLKLKNNSFVFQAALGICAASSQLVIETQNNLLTTLHIHFWMMNRFNYLRCAFK